MVFLIIGVAVLGGIYPEQAHAVIPPDFIFSIGAQVAQVFGALVFFISAAFGAMYSLVKQYFFSSKKGIAAFIGIIVFLLIGALGISYQYAQDKQQEEYVQWLEESKKYAEPFDDSITLDEGEYTKDELDQLDTNAPISNIDTTDQVFISNITEKEKTVSSQFVEQYYRNIAEHKFNDAYAMSKKGVDIATFSHWYEGATKITLDKFVQIDEKKSSLELTLYEGDEITRYAVLMTLAFDKEKPIRVESSEVRIFGTETIVIKPESKNEQTEEKEQSFFETNRGVSLIASNDELKKVLEEKRNDSIVLDAREDVEYDNGNLGTGLHIRFADLKAGRWIEVPNNKRIIVLCWSGIRGKEVAEFLRTKKIVSSYLEHGANGWVEAGGTWKGDIKFNNKYDEKRFQVVYSTDEVKALMQDKAFLVDSREPKKFKAGHIPGSVNIPIMYTPSINLDEVFAQVPEKSKVITICDGYVNCFDAKITGVELEKRGHQFLGRYNKPWEYK